MEVAKGDGDRYHVRWPADIHEKSCTDTHAHTLVADPDLLVELVGS